MRLATLALLALLPGAPAMIRLAIVAALMAGPAAALGKCAGRKAVVAMLFNEHGETRRGGGLNQWGSLIEVFSNDKTGTFTMALTSPDGKTCMLESGRGWTGEVSP